jgi:hypothetical protein
MNYNIDWKAVFYEIVWPNLTTFVFYLTIFLLFGIALSIAYVLYLWKKKVFVRKPKYYNRAVKLYIPFLFIVFIYFSFQIALLVSTKKIIHKETEKVVNELYEFTVSHYFDSPEDMELFILNLKVYSKILQDKSDSIDSKIEELITRNHANSRIKNEIKNRLALYLYKKYKIKLYSLAYYGLIRATNSEIGIGEMSIEDIDEIIKLLNTIDAEKIEKSIKQEFKGFVCKTVDSQIHKLIIVSLLVFIFIILLPVFDWMIYRWWMRRKVVES